MEFNGKYGINVINIGFDCEVVRRVVNIKKVPLVSGKMAYIFGVMGEFLHKKAMDTKVTVTYADGSTEVIEEKTLLIAVANGMFNKEIATSLNISERTVKNHISNIFKKIDVSDRTQAAVFAIKNNLIKLY